MSLNKSSLFLLLLMIAIASVFTSCDKTPADPNEDPPIAPLTNVEVISIPAGAQIYLDTTYRGLTPAIIQTATNAQNLKLTKVGYYDWSDKIYPSGQNYQIKAYLTAECPGDTIGDPNKAPYIKIVKTASNLIEGVATNIYAKEVRVVVWCKTDRWYVQPSIAFPLTNICGDSTWKCTVYPWNIVVALLVNQDYKFTSPQNSFPALAENVLSWDAYPNGCLPIGIVGDLNKSPEISIKEMSGLSIKGNANNIDAEKHRVVLWIYSDRWYVQPWVAAPYTDICGIDGSWSTTLSSSNWTKIVALVVDSSYNFSSPQTDHPADTKGVITWTGKPDLCPPFGIVGDLSKSPTIKITTSSQSYIQGVVNNVDIKKCRVVLWAGTNTWYIQPWVNAPFTQICGDNGSWQNTTHPWWQFYALLVDSTYVPSATSGSNPSSHKGVLAWDKLPK